MTALPPIDDLLRQLPRAGVEPSVRRQQPGEYDYLGRKQPRRFSLIDYLAAMPYAYGRVKRVPDRAIVEQRPHEVLLECPCGAKPVAQDRRIDKCPGCERYYGLFRDWTIVVYGEMEVPDGPAERTDSQ